MRTATAAGSRSTPLPPTHNLIGQPVGQETYETLSAASGISDALNAAIEKGLAELS